MNQILQIVWITARYCGVNATLQTNLSDAHHLLPEDPVAFCVALGAHSNNGNKLFFFLRISPPPRVYIFKWFTMISIYKIHILPGESSSNNNAGIELTSDVLHIAIDTTPIVSRCSIVKSFTLNTHPSIQPSKPPAIWKWHEKNSVDIFCMSVQSKSLRMDDISSSTQTHKPDILFSIR